MPLAACAFPSPPVPSRPLNVIDRQIRSIPQPLSNPLQQINQESPTQKDQPTKMPAQKRSLTDDEPSPPQPPPSPPPYAAAEEEDDEGEQRQQSPPPNQQQPELPKQEEGKVLFDAYDLELLRTHRFDFVVQIPTRTRMEAAELRKMSTSPCSFTLWIALLLLLLLLCFGFVTC